jgi:uncharacterized membrane protein
MPWFVAAHATGATLALLLGAYNVLRRTKGDPVHRRIGAVWVVAMYWTVLSSFAIKQLNPGHFSWIHLLSVWTFVTLTIGLTAAITGRARLHRRFITGSYFGLLGAFAGAVAVPSRAIPQLVVHRPLEVVVASGCCVLAAGAIIGYVGKIRSSTSCSATRSPDGSNRPYSKRLRNSMSTRSGPERFFSMDTTTQL